MKKTLPQVAIYVGNTGFSLYHFRLALMSHMKKMGWDVRAIANEEADFGLKFTKHEIGFLNVEIDHKGLNPLNDIRFLLHLHKIYKMLRPRLVHHFTIKPVIFGSLAAKIAHVPAIINTITGLGYTFDKSGWLQWMTCRLYTVALRGKAKVIFENGDDLFLFRRRRIVSFENSYSIKGCGVDTGAIQPKIEARKNSPLFLMLSRMLWSKGVREFVSAARNVKELYPSSEFIMVGGYSGGGARKNPNAVEEDWLRQVNREGVVRWMGRVPFETVMDLLDQVGVCSAALLSRGLASVFNRGCCCWKSDNNH